MSLKSELRIELRAKRKAIDNKENKDSLICEKLLSSELYNSAKTVLFYAALDEEINIDKCIADSLSKGKITALPVCVNNRGDMEYYAVKSFDDLVSGSFGVREPNKEKCSLLTDFTDALCVVPGIAFDSKGYRIGYGKGYYDRFLKNNSVFSLGLCYNSLTEYEIPYDDYDIPVNGVLTENGLLRRI